MNLFKISLICLFLASCAFGQKTDYTQGHFAFQSFKMPENTACLITVIDSRPYVLSGDKKASFTGINRGGYGNPFDVHTTSGNPLAQDLSLLMVKSYLQQNNVVCDSAPLANKNYSKVITYEFREWKTDTRHTGRFFYDIDLVVESGGDKTTKQNVSGVDTFTREIPLVFSILKALDDLHNLPAAKEALTM